MSSHAEYLHLPLEEKLRLVSAIWDSIAEDQESVADSPEVVREVRERVAEYKANPGTAIPWDKVKKNLRPDRG